MKNIKQIIIYGVVLGLGLLIGYLISQNSARSTNEADHLHAEQTADGAEYTCAMHPQIRQNEPGICPICEMDLVEVDASMGNEDPSVLQMTEEAVNLAQVETFLVGAGSPLGLKNNAGFNVDGTVELDERTVKSQTAHMSGRIEKMAVSFEGQYVKAGQEIATIFSTELLAASEELITAAKFEDRVEGIQDAAIQKLSNWKITQAQIAQIISTEKPIERVTIYADHSGYVLSKKSSLGDYVELGQPLYTLGSTARLWLIFNVFENDLAGVSKGSEITFSTPSVANEKFTARVTYINPILNSSTRTATIRAEISNKGNKLKPGMLLRGQIKGNTKNQAGKEDDIKIPNSAILWTGDKSVVYVQLQDRLVPSFEFREIEIASRNAETSIISSGLAVGDIVVSHGAFTIDAAAQLNNNSSMMNRNVSVRKQINYGVENFVEETPQEFKDQLDDVVRKYLELKDALVATDEETATIKAGELLIIVEKVQMDLLSGEAQVYWIQQNILLRDHIAKITGEGNVEVQRQEFDHISTSLIKVLQAYGTTERSYFVQHCPMANGNKGAAWISGEREILNPYYGQKMLKCGTVRLEL